MPFRSQTRWEAVVDALCHYYFCGLRKPEERYARPCRSCSPFDPLAEAVMEGFSDCCSLHETMYECSVTSKWDVPCARYNVLIEPCWSEVTRAQRNDDKCDCICNSIFLAGGGLLFGLANAPVRLVTLLAYGVVRIPYLAFCLSMSIAARPLCCLCDAICCTATNCCDTDDDHRSAQEVTSLTMGSVSKRCCPEFHNAMDYRRKQYVDYYDARSGGRSHIALPEAPTSTTPLQPMPPLPLQPQAPIYHQPQPMPRLLRQPHIPASQLRVDKNTVLGQGGFGIVYRGTWNDIAVAVKQLRESALTPDVTSAFQREVDTMSSLDHPNIVILYGSVTDRAPHYMVMELMDTSLDKILHDPTLADIPWHERMRYAHDIASGLGYLHDKKIVHRDLKSKNVLADENRRLKLTDFGLARVKEASLITDVTSAYVGGVKGTYPWMAPELLLAEGKEVPYKENTDVYAYAMTVWEIAARQFPYSGLDIHQIVIAVTVRNKRPDIPVETPPVLTQIMENCWVAEPSRRFKIPDVIARLDQAMRSGQTQHPHPSPSPMPARGGPQFAGITGEGVSSQTGPSFAGITDA